MSDQLNKPSRALIAYAVLADKIIKGNDLVQSLMPFFRPIAAAFAGQYFDAEKFCNEISNKYGLDVPKLAALGWCDRLRKEGLLEEHAKTPQGAVYRYPQGLTANPSEIADTLTESQVLNILEGFRTYARSTLPSEFGSVLDNDLDEAFYSRLLNIDSMRILTRKESKADINSSANTLSLKQQATLPHEKLELHLDFLVAEYLIDTKSKNESIFRTISAIAFANMAAEAVATFRDPPSNGAQSLSRVRIYLDTPLVLDLFGLNDGFESYTQELWTLIQGSGGTVAVFDHTVEEIQSVIFARLSAYRSGNDPFRNYQNGGFVVNRLAVLNGNVGSQLEDRNISIDRDPEISLLRISQSALGTIQAGLDKKMSNWRTEARHYDEKSVLSMIAIRNGGGAEANFVKAVAVLLTRNTSLTAIANAAWRKWLMEAGRESKTQIDKAAPIAISDKQFAGLLWMLNGGASAALSHERLIAHCSSAIRPRSDVIAKVCNLIIEAHGKDKGLEFSALLTNRRAEQALMHAASGDPEILTTKNLPEIIERVTLAAGDAAAAAARAEAEIERDQLAKGFQEEIARRDADVSSAQSAASSARQGLEAVRLQAETDLSALTRANIALKIDQKQSEKTVLDNRINFLELAFNRGRKGYRFARYGLFVAYVALLLLGILWNEASLAGYAFLLIGGVVGFWYFPENLLEPICQKNGHQNIENYFTHSSKPTEGFVVDFRSKEFSLLTQSMALRDQVDHELDQLGKQLKK